MEDDDDNVVSDVSSVKTSHTLTDVIGDGTNFYQIPGSAHTNSPRLYPHENVGRSRVPRPHGLPSEEECLTLSLG